MGVEGGRRLFQQAIGGAPSALLIAAPSPANVPPGASSDADYPEQQFSGMILFQGE